MAHRRTIIAFFTGAIFGASLVIGAGLAFVYYTESISERQQPEWMPDFDERLFDSATQLAAARTEYERWIATSDVAIWLIDSGGLARAEALANEALKEAEKYPADWNFGNAIHKSNIALGRIAIRQNNIEEAKRRLLMAAEMKGSPQLNSFGPNMILAKELLEKGESATVLTFLTNCRKFWKLGDSRLNRWEAQIRAGERPAFGANLVY